jgi:hypothetical protein
MAENIAPAGGDDSLKSALTAAGYTFLETLYGNELFTDIDPHLGEIVSFGFIALSKSSELVASIRGTATIMEWLHDGAFLMAPSPIPGLVGMTEDGFTAIYRSLRTDKAVGSPSAVTAVTSHLAAGVAQTVTICGHSLGGALATLLTLDVALNALCRTPVVYTYASPRTGDHLFANGFNSCVSSSDRIINRQDLVPQLAPILPLPYEHANTKYELNPPYRKIKQTIVCMHHLATYIWLMEQLASSGTDALPTECVGP